MQQPWAPPEQAQAPASPGGGGRFVGGTPLGGVASVQRGEPERRTSWRDLTVVAALLVASVLTAVATMMSWRDYGPALDPNENGWRLADGGLGRGWIAILVAVALAVGGVLIASRRRRSGRIWARLGSSALILGPMVEWAFGDGGIGTGPGIGLWIMLVTGMVLMVLLGSVLPTDDLDGAGQSPIAAT